MKSLFASLVCAGALALVTIGGVACDDAEELYDCALLCEAYEDCAGELGQEVDLTECINHCEDEADMTEDFEAMAQDCQDCLEAEGRSCTESFVCADECIDVVPTVVF